MTLIPTSPSFDAGFREGLGFAASSFPDVPSDVDVGVVAVICREPFESIDVPEFERGFIAGCRYAG